MLYTVHGLWTHWHAASTCCTYDVEVLTGGARGADCLPCPAHRLAPVAIKRLKDQSPEQQVQFLKEMAILRACRGSRYVVNFVGASLLPVRLACGLPASLRPAAPCGTALHPQQSAWP